MSREYAEYKIQKRNPDETAVYCLLFTFHFTIHLLLPHILHLDKVKSVAYLRSFWGFEVWNEGWQRQIADYYLGMNVRAIRES